MYWRVRTQKTLERLEREARRMLQLEADLSHFAEQYYAHVGAYAERLATLESMLVVQESPEVTPRTMHEVQHQREMVHARQSELKTRYRSLAKEIHPDRAMAVNGTGTHAAHMQSLNEAYAQGDLSAMLRLEAEMLLARDLNGGESLEVQLREIERAADTYAAGYRQLLNSPLNELMLRQLSAQLAGWNWVDAVVQRVQRAIEQSERALVAANIAAIGDWRISAQAA
ncbi:MAG: hypothetical protein B7X02_00400 [Rhodospirillales bacterium 12-54-5]|nr:MAG: hypothetical protein B7X02_00400 [Rhodospirillales bacterium 12-54-5]